MVATCYVDEFELDISDLDAADIFSPDPSVAGWKLFENEKKKIASHRTYQQKKKPRVAAAAVAPQREQKIYHRLGPVSILGRRGYVLSSCQEGSEEASNPR